MIGQIAKTSSAGHTQKNVIIGLCAASLWGVGMAAQIRSRHITWDRTEFVMPDMDPTYSNPDEVAALGYSLMAIINTPDTTDLTTISPAAYAAYGLALIQQYPEINIWEVINEPYYKPPRSQPEAYADLAKALYDAVDAAGITGKKLLIASYGDYYNGSAWSQVPNNGGWIRNMANRQPSLLQRADGFVAHPYGFASNGPTHNGYNQGQQAMVTLHNHAVALGFRNTDYYITEIGFNINGSTHTIVSSPAQAVIECEASYNILLSYPWVRGIWYFAARDYGVDENWGVFDRSHNPRPMLDLLSNYARKNGQF